MRIPTHADHLPLIRQVTAVAALVAAGSALGLVVMQFLIVEPVLAFLGAEGLARLLASVAWLLVLASVLAISGVFAGWRLAEFRWAEGVAVVLLGLVLHWGYWVADHVLNAWSWLFPELRRMEPDDAAARRALGVVFWGWLIMEAVVTLLLFGGLRLLRSPLSDRRRRREALVP